MSVTVTLSPSSIPYRKAFHSANKSTNETVDDWYNRLKDLAQPCNYGCYLEVLLLDKLIVGLDDTLLERLCTNERDLSVKNVIEISRYFETTNEHIDIKPELVMIKQELTLSDVEPDDESNYDNEFIDDDSQPDVAEEAFDKTQQLLCNRPKLFECYLCHKSWPTVGHLTYHFGRHHTMGTTSKCHLCGKWLRTPSSLVRHVNMHLSDRPYHCDLCDFSFASSISLKRHMVRHNESNANPFECSKCQKAFISQRHLRLHRKTHKDNTTLSHAPLDSHTSTTTTESPPLKRRQKVSKKWMKVRDFSNFDEAAQAVKNENVWSKCNTNINKGETSVVYRCNKVKSRGEQCMAGVRLLLSTFNDTTTLFKSDHAHTCDTINEIYVSTRCKLSDEAKASIKRHFDNGLKYKQIRDELIKENIQLPSTSKMNNYLANLRKQKYGQATLSLSELRDVLQSSTNVPVNIDDAYVVDFNINDDGNAKMQFFVTSKTLLRNAVDTKLVCANTNYKLLWQGFPVYITGTVDVNKKFHPFGISVTDTEELDDFKFMFESLKKGVAMNYNSELNCEVLMNDAYPAIGNAFKEVFGNKLILMCSALMKKATKYKVDKLIPKAHRDELLHDIDMLQLSQTPNIFEKASQLFLAKYKMYEEFVEYFKQQWLIMHRNWYEGAAPLKTPSTDNALETFYRTLKNENSLRERLPLEIFMKLLFDWIKSWGEAYTSGENIVCTTQCVNVNTSLLTQGYQWLYSNKRTIKNIDGSVMVPAGDQADLVDWNKISQWESFDEFKQNAFLGWTTVVPEGDNWINGTCTCPGYYKEFLCKHIVGIAMRHKYLAVPIEAKIVPTSSQRKRGRPPIAKRALLLR